MPGPFNSDKIKGVFERDTASIKQNDIWSSATFNRFVKSVYNVFYNESAYSRVFHNPDKPRLMLDCSNVQDGGAIDDGTDIAVKTPNIWFHDNKDKSRIEMHIVDRNFDVNADIDSEGDPTEGHMMDKNKKRLLFSGRGDVSISSKPYALFQVLSDTEVTPPEALQGLSGAEADPSNIRYDAYCCITYKDGTEVANGTSLSDTEIIPRYSSLSEITFQFDPTLQGTVISVVEGDKVKVAGDIPHQEDVTVKLTLSFGPEVTLSDFVMRMNGFTTLNLPRYKAVIVGQALANQTLIQALIGSSDPEAVPTDIYTKTVRFVPIRPCITVADSLASESFENLTCPEGDLSSITAYKVIESDSGITDEAVPVFVNTGTYGFIISNSLADAPVIHNAADLDLIYIPNKNAAHHYTTPENMPNPQVPEWYSTLPGRITRAKTEGFNTEFFFVPYITVTDRTIEIGDFSISIDTILTYGDVNAAINSEYMQPLKESNVIYDSETLLHQNAENKELLHSAQSMFEQMQPMLSGISEGGIYTSLGSHASVGLNVKEPVVFSLERTLQFMLGVSWKNNNVIWIDPLVQTPDRSKKVYASVNQAIMDDVAWGRGSLITSDTIFIHVTSSDVDGPYYSNYPVHPSYQTDSSAPHRNMWREMYSEYLSYGIKHITVKAKDDSTGSILDDDFAGFNFEAGHTPLYIRLKQDPNLNYIDPSNYTRQSELDASRFPDRVDHLLCMSKLTGEYIDLNSDYYPLAGQDFSQTSLVVIDDPEAGLRVPGKQPNTKIYLYGIKANTFTYIPRQFWYKSGTTFTTQTLKYDYGVDTGSIVTTTAPVRQYLPSEDPRLIPGSTDNVFGFLDYMRYNGEVVIKHSSIEEIRQGRLDFELGEDQYLAVCSCISMLNINPDVTKTILLAHSEPGWESSIYSIPAAGELMLWRGKDITCLAEVSTLKLCGAGGSQTIRFAPVAWPFNAKKTGLCLNPASINYTYHISSEGVVSGSYSKGYFVGLGVAESDLADVIGTEHILADVTGGDITLGLCFADRRDVDKETRKRSEFASFIKVFAPVRNCAIDINIEDNMNEGRWYPPSASHYTAEADKPYYGKGTWQAFDPDIFLPPADWVSGTSYTEWSTDFHFIDCYNRYDRPEDVHKPNPYMTAAVFNNCKITVDLSHDAEYDVASSVKVGSDAHNQPWGVVYTQNKMFFSSRIFRQSPYIFYLAGELPERFGTTTFKNTHSYSRNVDLSIVADTKDSVSRQYVGWYPYFDKTTAYTTSTDNDPGYINRHTSHFIFGMSGGTISVDNFRVWTVVRSVAVVDLVRSGADLGRQRYTAGPNDYHYNTAVALFSAVNNCKINIGILDTKYPLVDEWEYVRKDAYAYDPYDQATTEDKLCAVWLEPCNGFQFFTSPAWYGKDETPRCFNVNRNNTLTVGLWSTRTLLSGIFGLSESTVDINYDFNTQSFDLFSYSKYPADFTDAATRITYYSQVGVRETCLDYGTNKYATAKRPRYWAQKYSDPGSERWMWNTTVGESLYYCANCLPCAPLFYLAEVDSCTINLKVASRSGHQFYTIQQDEPDTHHAYDMHVKEGQAIPCNSFKYTKDSSEMAKNYSYNAYRKRLYQALSGKVGDLANEYTHSPLPHAGVSIDRDFNAGADSLDYSRITNARRTLRLAIGFALSRQDYGDRYMLPSSCNTIYGMFTRANLVTGLYNHVSGWCFGLASINMRGAGTGICYKTPECYVPYNGESDTAPYISALYRSWPKDNADAERRFDNVRSLTVGLDNGETVGLLDSRLGAIHYKGMRKMWTLDNAVARCYGGFGIWSNSRFGFRSPDEEEALYEILAYTQNNALADGLISNTLKGKALPHIGSGLVDWLGGFSLPTDASSPARSATVKSVLADGVVNAEATQFARDGGQVGLLAWLLWVVNFYPEGGSGGYLYAQDAYNTADLNVILLSTSPEDVPYFKESTPSLGGNSVTPQLSIPFGRPIHTVLGLLLNPLDDPEAESLRSITRVVHESQPGLSEEAVQEISEAIRAGRLGRVGDTISIDTTEENLARAGLSSSTMAAIMELAQQADSGVAASQAVDGNVTNPVEGYTMTIGGLDSIMSSAAATPITTGTGIFRP